MIALRNVDFSYPDKEILTNFTLELPEQGCVALMGPSGCGKTTILRLVMGLEKPRKGIVENAPYPVAAVFQEDRLLAHKTVLENAALAGDPAVATRLLTALGLGQELNSDPASLSGGMRRRVAIARALATPAPLLVLDEPFNGLDDATKRLSAALILQEWKGPILAVTHLAEEAALLEAKIVKLG